MSFILAAAACVPAGRADVGRADSTNRAGEEAPLALPLDFQSETSLLTFVANTRLRRRFAPVKDLTSLGWDALPILQHLARRANDSDAEVSDASEKAWREISDNLEHQRGTPGQYNNLFRVHVFTAADPAVPPLIRSEALKWATRRGLSTDYSYTPRVLEALVMNEKWNQLRSVMPGVPAHRADSLVGLFANNPTPVRVRLEATLVPGPPIALPSIEKLLDSKDRGMILAGARLAGRADVKTETLVPRLMDLLKRDDAAYRAAGVQALAAIWSPDSKAEGRKSPPWGAAADGQFTQTPPDAVLKAIQARTADEDSDVVDAANQALSRLKRFQAQSTPAAPASAVQVPNGRSWVIGGISVAGAFVLLTAIAVIRRRILLRRLSPQPAGMSFAPADKTGPATLKALRQRKDKHMETELWKKITAR